MKARFCKAIGFLGVLLLHFSVDAQTHAIDETKKTTRMKEYVFIMRITVATLTQEQLTDLRATWTTVVDQWKKQDIFVTSNQIVQEGMVVTGNERTLRKGSVADDGMRIVSTINVRAASLEEAAVLAKACPTLTYGGTVEIREKLN